MKREIVIAQYSKPGILYAEIATLRRIISRRFLARQLLNEGH
jgi:hypothetical protein